MDNPEGKVAFDNQDPKNVSPESSRSSENAGQLTPGSGIDAQPKMGNQTIDPDAVTSKSDPTGEDKDSKKSPNPDIANEKQISIILANLPPAELAKIKTFINRQLHYALQTALIKKFISPDTASAKFHLFIKTHKTPHEIEESLFDFQNPDASKSLYQKILHKYAQKAESSLKSYNKKHPKSKINSKWSPKSKLLQKLIQRETNSLVEQELGRLQQRLEKKYSYRPSNAHESKTMDTSFSKGKPSGGAKGLGYNSGIRCLFLAMEKINSVEIETNLT